MRTLIITIVLLLITTNAHSLDLNVSDNLRLNAINLLMVDYQQTYDAASKGWATARERNSVLGSTPSAYKVTNYFAVATIISQVANEYTSGYTHDAINLAIIALQMAVTTSNTKHTHSNTVPRPMVAWTINF